MLPFLNRKERFYCEELTSNLENRELIKSFYIEIEKEYNINSDEDSVIGLEQFLKRAAWQMDVARFNKFYLIKDRKTKKIAAYFGLKAGMVSLNDNDINSQEDINYINRLEKNRSKTKQQGYMPIKESIPGIELSHFAINDDFRLALEKETGHEVHGLGNYFFPRFIYPIILDVSNKIGVKFFYLYAADRSDDGKLINYYKNVMKLSQLKTVSLDMKEQIKPMRSDYDNNCTFMYRIID